MSDKSFGDHLNRNIVKNPLLSSAVTGLSIEDLTHNAVLLPAAPSQELITRHDQIGPQIATLAHADRKTDNFPPGDANSNILHPNLPPINTLNTLNIQKNDQNQKSTESKALPKSDDDFDVNEYFARLQGTRYVSAPLNSLIKEDQKNIEATEENLEEINLNEPEKIQNVEVQQSLTADIAQNFSQLPTVLPQVASAVFSSFSSMLSMKSREQTPDVSIAKPPEYQEVQFSRSEGVGVPLMGVDEPVAPKEVAPPPRELPVGGTSNYRITTKKKTYAQIPGLSSTNTAPYNPAVDSTPFHHIQDNTTNYIPPQPPTNVIDVNKRTEISNIPPTQSQINISAVSDRIGNLDNFNQPLQTNLKQQAPYATEYNLFTPATVPENTLATNEDPIQRDYNIFNPSTTEENPSKVVEANLFGETAPNLFTTVEQNSAQQGSAANTSIIPPPPMFSNLPRRDSQGSSKSVLPPSVARRIGSNHPIIKPQSYSSMAVPKDIFVPAPISETAPEISSFDSTITSLSKDTVTHTVKTDAPPASIGSAFVQFNTTSLTQEKSITIPTQIGTPISNLTAAAPTSTNPSTANMFPPASVMPSLFTPNLPPASSVENQTVLSTTEYPPANVPISETAAPPPMFFNPSSLSLSTQPPTETTSIPQSFASDKMVPPSIGQLPPPPTLFNPNTSTHISADAQGISQYNMPSQSFDQSTAIEASKAVPEPPKLSGSLNYRMQKKRPQYYSGPIEGVGAISNNVKPTITPTLQPNAFIGSLFTPETTEPAKEQPVLNINPAVVPEQAIPPNPYAQFDLNAPQTQNYIGSDYNTAFDMSRQTTDNYEPPKQETKGFGIIGSLKSKLSSLDINKIQSTVTTFFDPAYNDTKIDQTNTQGQYNESTPPYGYTRNQDSNLEVFVPTVEQSDPVYNQNYGQYNQYAQNYGQNDQYAQNYGQNDQYYQNQTYGTGSQDQSYTTPSLYTSFDQNSSASHNYGSSANMYETSSSINTQIPQNEVVSRSETQKTEANSAISSFFTQNLDNVSRDSTQGAIDISNKFNEPVGQQILSSPAELTTLAAPYYAGNKTEPITSLFSSETTSDNQRENLKNIEPTDTASLFDVHRHFDLSQSMHTEDLNRKLENLQIEQEKEENIDLEKILPGDIVAEVFSNVTKVSAPQDQQKTTIGSFFTNFPSEDNKDAGFLQSSSFFESNQSDADIGGYGSSYFQSGNDYKDSLIKESVKDDIPCIDPTAMPLFGLPNVLAPSKPASDIEGEVKKGLLFGAEREPKVDHETKDGSQPIAKDDNDDTTELNICETCREVNVSEDKETDDLTSQLIENITAPIQLSNPVVAPLAESNTVSEDTSFELKQCAEISHITEETIETIQVQSATELLDSEVGVSNPNTLQYGWNTSIDAPFNPPEVLLDHDYNFQIDPNAIGFFSNNSLFFEDIPKNASDELKAEFKSSHEETPLFLPRQMSIPSAPPAEDDDTKSDETGGLDVHSIEQDAKKDFPIDEEFVIEPSETDDDKIEYRERERSSEDPVQDVDTFTNRVERFKQMGETVDKTDDVFSLQKSQLFDMNTATSPPITIASYFDTGNYAAETHYRNSISSPSNLFQVGSPNISMSIPPGFESEYKRRMSELSIRNQDNKSDKDDNVPYIPDTSTQTRPVVTTTYSMVTNISQDVTVTSSMMVTTRAQEIPLTTNLQQSVPETISKEYTPVMTKLPEFASVFGQKLESGDTLASSLFTKEDKEPAFKTEEKIEPIKTELADPISFFSSNDTPNEANDNNFNRLASYFTSPAKNDHGKSFFELSQSQNHYRHANNNHNNTQDNKTIVEPKLNLQNIPTDVYLANLTLMNDLTAVRNVTVSPKDQIRTVNYFTVEYENDIELKNGVNIGEPDLKKVDTDNVDREKLEECDVCDDTKLITVVSKCKYCCNNIFQHTITLNKVAFDSDFKVRKVIDSDTNNTDNKADQKPNMDQRSQERRTEVTVSFGNPAHDESDGASTAVESRTSSEYSPVKHHWFYRVDFEGKSIWRGFSATDNRALEDAFVKPDLDERTVVATDGGRFDVNIVGRLRTAVYWADKPTNVRRCSWFYKGTTDARYVPYTETVAEKLEEEYRRGVSSGEWHRRLVLPGSELVVMHGPAVMVHFPTDAPAHSPQSTMRPRVVRRGCDESEIEDTEPSSIDHLLLLCHGVGSACDMRFRSVEEVVDDFRATSLQLLQSHYKNSYEKGVVNRVEVLPISWHATLHSGETGVDRRLSAITLESIPRLRNFTNDTVLDVLFYTSPVFCQTIIDTVCAELNRMYSLFVSRNPGFSGRVSLGGHSLGSVILYDLLCHQPQESKGSPAVKSYVEGAAGTGQVTVRYPSLAFRPAALYALGSPIAMFECIRGVKSLGVNFALPTCKNFFNIFHPYDPIAYRIEPLINSQLGTMKPFLIPHHKGRKRMHLELKDTMARVGADLKQKLIESLKSTWSSMWKSQPPNDAHLEKVVEEEIEKEQLCDDSKDEVVQNDIATPEMLGQLNSGRRVDYVLQETPFEMINEYLFAMSSHVCYWESEDTMLLILREIYDALGVQPDCTVPQQTLTVQRSRQPSANEAYVVSTSEYPSTSRDGT